MGECGASMDGYADSHQIVGNMHSDCLPDRSKEEEACAVEHTDLKAKQYLGICFQFKSPQEERYKKGPT